MIKSLFNSDAVVRIEDKESIQKIKSLHAERTIAE